MEVVLIAAVAENDVIGKDGEMPWHYPEDLQHFKNETLGSPVIMGRITYESIVEATGGPLTDRTTIVLTQSPDSIDTSLNEVGGLELMCDVTRVYTAGSVDEALSMAATQESDEVFVAGGASVYEQFFPIADTLLMTEIHDSFDGDTEFPEWNDDEWVAVNRDDHDELSFVTYRRVGAVTHRPSRS